jgi:hypothetical protein
MTTPYTDWVCASAAVPPAGTESSLAIPGATGGLAAALGPKSPDTGGVGSFGPTPLPIPFALQQPSTSAAGLHEIPTATTTATTQLWGGAEGYAEPAVFGSTPPDLAAVFADVLPAAAGYDVAGAQVGLDEFINAL